MEVVRSIWTTGPPVGGVCTLADHGRSQDEWTPVWSGHQHGEENPGLLWEASLLLISSSFWVLPLGQSLESPPPSFSEGDQSQSLESRLPPLGFLLTAPCPLFFWSPKLPHSAVFITPNFPYASPPPHLYPHCAPFSSLPQESLVHQS